MDGAICRTTLPGLVLAAWLGALGCGSESTFDAGTPRMDAASGRDDAGTADEDAGGSAGDDAGSECSGCVAEDGSCLAGDRPTACGQGGVACETCGAGLECTDGTCAEPTLCGDCDGCCDGDTCVAGDEASACGAGGLQCEACSGDERCIEGTCQLPCNATTCSTGCCDDAGACVERDAQDDMICGTGGEACIDCSAISATCEAGACVEASCSRSCDGCCDGSGTDVACQADGSSNDEACGIDGVMCRACSAGTTCSAGACEAEPESEWDLVVIDGELNPRNLDDGAWDFGGGRPDPRVEVVVEDDVSGFDGQTSDLTDTLTPTWEETTVTAVKARQLMSRIEITVVDNDTIPNPDDFVGTCETSLAADEIDPLIVHTLDCPRDAELEQSGWRVRFRVVPHGDP